MSLPTRRIGGTQVSALGFGAMGLSMAYGDVPSDSERLDFLDAVYARGCTFLDTSDSYGDSEALLGRWFARSGRRKDVFLATKFGLGPVVRGESKIPRAEPDYVPQALAASLSKLGTDYVDLCYLHRPSPEVPIEKTVGAMAELVKQGKVKYLGLSEVSSEDLRRAHAVHPIAAIQVEYSVMDLSIETIGLLKTARELDISVVAYSPLGRGLLTLQYKSLDDLPEKDTRRMIPRMNAANFPNIVQLAEEVQAIGLRNNATPGQIALAWLLAQGNDIIPIPGTKKIKYLEENLGAVHVRLSEHDVAAVRQLAEKSNEAVPGERYPDWFAFSFKTTPPM
ncbi:Aldo/keto reductase, partial [Peniophora sp. CONT]